MRRILLLLAALALTSPARAQAPMLYELRLPDGFALIRYANGLEAATSLRSEFDLPRELGTEDAARVSRYFVVENAAGRELELRIASGGATASASFRVNPNTFNTVLLLREGGRIVARHIEDSTEYNRLRARLTFYNAAPGCAAATLALDPSGRPVIPDLAFPGMQARTITPAAAKLRVQCGADRVGPLDLGRLEAGQLASLWLMAPGGRPVFFTSRDLIAPPGQ
ncbi:ABC transporter permease [Falsiroseomonas tokyonensis]|uniref:ABC transporter permease n=1 Tax=Falsiroseomonas tokyonensis TaxID=430521 RepID=A0ABV7BPN6_9PROT|nr:ABC transporter permease [Falsiroseomonas tokyonensis]MBU8536534.1 ABC transporter permease [Falsiroseomonas tokyonensis]